MKNSIAEELIEFISKSPTCFHVTDNIKKILDEAGFVRLQESGEWKLEVGGRYYVTRNNSSVIAFYMPEHISGFHIMASHSDSPCFKIKENPEIGVAEKYVKLNVEKYGGMLMSTWFDRPLSVAGRLVTENEGKITTHLVNMDRDTVIIPNLAIHMNRNINEEGYKYNAQKDLLPLFGDEKAEGTFMTRIAEAAGVEEASIVSHDLFLYPRVPGSIWGPDDAYISSARLDDLECVFSSMKGFLALEHCSNVPVLAVLDNEEVGSTTKQGAASDFMRMIVTRICYESGLDAKDINRLLAGSFMVSADNAHAAHPNYMEKADPVNRPYMNEGIVIKYNANQKDTTDGISAALFKQICRKAGVPYQTFFNRSDVAGGSTLGNISNTQLSMNTVDIGLAQLSMHSTYETAGTKDIEYLVRASRAFFEAGIQCEEDGGYTIE